ncbi:DUF3572 domain-containing protein [Mesorhizobium sp. SB112]|uniref:DUF3572 domain-containing protein n=1 Tax=Mesorhizobium sp. SB112 TaxID=3151853 RepID=UPI0032636A68
MNRQSLTPENAETIAVSALAFIASDPELLPRFLSMTGIEANAIRAAASEPGFLAGVMQFIVAHEPTLMRFSQESGIAPETIAASVKALPLGDDDSYLEA